MPRHPRTDVVELARSREARCLPPCSSALPERLWFDAQAGGAVEILHILLLDRELVRRTRLDVQVERGGKIDDHLFALEQVAQMAVKEAAGAEVLDAVDLEPEREHRLRSPL